MKNYFDQTVQLYKLCCDGYDFVNRIEAFEYSEMEIQYANRHCIINNFDKLNEFYKYSIQERKKTNIDYFGLNDYLLDKYEVGYYQVQLGLNFHDNYILFSDENISKWQTIIPIIGLEFMVTFSRNWNGNINGIGLRILDTKIVHDAFKWLFPLGQKCTFGLQYADKNDKLILVEGFTDMIAGQESGYLNCIGLGSVEITDDHKLELNTDNYVFCPDQDSYGMQIRRESDNWCLFSPEKYKDPYEAYKQTGRVNFHLIK